MFNIGDFFKRIQNTHSREVFLRSVVRDSIKKYTQNDVPIEAISFSSDKVSLKGLNQSLLSVIFIKKGQIIEDINKSQRIKKVSDIR